MEPHPQTRLVDLIAPDFIDGKLAGAEMDRRNKRKRGPAVGPDAAAATEGGDDGVGDQQPKYELSNI